MLNFNKVDREQVPKKLDRGREYYRHQALDDGDADVSESLLLFQERLLAFIFWVKTNQEPFVSFGEIGAVGPGVKSIYLFEIVVNVVFAV